MRFCPKKTPLSRRRYEASVRSGSVPFLAVSWSIVVITQRSHGFTTAKETPPMDTVFQSSSANGAAPDTTKLGRNRFMGTGSTKRLFRSSSEAWPMSKKGYASARLTFASGRAYRGSIGRALGSGKATRRQDIPSFALNQALTGELTSTIDTTSFQIDAGMESPSLLSTGKSIKSWWGV